VPASSTDLVQLLLFVISLACHNKTELSDGRYFRDLLTAMEFYRYFRRVGTFLRGRLHLDLYGILIWTVRHPTDINTSTWTTKELYPHWNAFVPVCWYNSDVACYDLLSQFVVHNGVTVLISIKHLKTTVTKICTKHWVAHTREGAAGFMFPSLPPILLPQIYKAYLHRLHQSCISTWDA
jgi:hypothetical protein